VQFYLQKSVFPIKFLIKKMEYSHVWWLLRELSQSFAIKV